MNRKYYLKDIRKINSMKELQYHKLRLELATDYLEDKIEGNIKDIKYELSPIRLLRMLIIRLFHRGKKSTADAANNVDEDDGSPNLMKQFWPLVEGVVFKR